MFIGRDFPPFQNQSARLLGFNMVNLLQAGETITAITSRLRISDPALDNLPATHITVAPTFSGSLVNQMVSFDDPADYLLGNVYALSFNVTTTSRLMTPWSRFQIIQGYGVTTTPDTPAPASATSLILPAPFYDYTLPVLLGAYVGVDFPSANQSEALFYGFDFSAALSPYETIDSASSFLALYSGEDDAVLASPHAYDSGSIVIEGPIVRRKLVWPGGSSLTANTYVLQLTAVTNYNQSLAAKAKINIAKVA